MTTGAVGSSYGTRVGIPDGCRIEKAGENGNDRKAVVNAFFAIKDRDSVLGHYSIDRNGDTTASQEGGYRVKHGKQVFDTVLTAKQAA